MGHTSCALAGSCVRAELSLWIAGEVGAWGEPLGKRLTEVGVERHPVEGPAVRAEQARDQFVSPRTGTCLYAPDSSLPWRRKCTSGAMCAPATSG